MIDELASEHKDPLWKYSHGFILTDKGLKVITHENRILECWKEET